jgi:tRNA threonylcarbamoyladenosine biosynthesis protein TsaE
MITLHTSSAAGTRALGAMLAGVLERGDVVLLCGELGAGKTTLVQGIGAAFGVDEPMTSPTFILVHTYGEDPVLAHVDAWRLENLGEVLDLGLDELLDEGAIALVEWGNRIAGALGRDAFVVEITQGPDDESRVITISSPSPALEARLKAIELR